MKKAANGERIEGPSYSAFLKVALASDPSNSTTATAYAFELRKFPELVKELETFIKKCRARGVEYVEGRPIIGVM